MIRVFEVKQYDVFVFCTDKAKCKYLLRSRDSIFLFPIIPSHLKLYQRMLSINLKGVLYIYLVIISDTEGRPMIDKRSWVFILFYCVFKAQ